MDTQLLSIYIDNNIHKKYSQNYILFMDFICNILSFFTLVNVFFPQIPDLKYKINKLLFLFWPKSSCVERLCTTTAISATIYILAV